MSAHPNRRHLVALPLAEGKEDMGRGSGMGIATGAVWTGTRMVAVADRGWSSCAAAEVALGVGVDTVTKQIWRKCPEGIALPLRVLFLRLTSVHPRNPSGTLQSFAYTLHLCRTQLHRTVIFFTVTWTR